ncbi:penicillin-binding protein [Rhodobacterales bacterium HTCC2150]|nr:penicillin-binding protein [Rhodobacterales bacterium HTCC2150] [Rhodobacteraceae bacterium HTCC2150]
MSRVPLRPLARILSARQKGEDHKAIENENIHQRMLAARGRQRQMAEGRLLIASICFAVAFSAVGVKMFALSSTEPREPRTASSASKIYAQRANIVDRNGRILATNLSTYSLYAQPHLMTDPENSAVELATIFPDLGVEDLLEDFTGKRKFLWIKKKISPEQKQRVHDIGDPGLLFGPREMRLYPNGKLAAHVLGGAGFGREDVHSAEVIGNAGVERTFDAFLRDPAQENAPLELAIDLSVQDTAERVLYGGMKLMNAKAASSVLMDVKTGEIISLVSLPDFDPNTRPNPKATLDAADNPLFNRAVQGVYELGSTFKLFTIAQALELGLMNKNTMIPTRGPLVWGKFKIRDFHDYGAKLSVTDVLVKSSNIGTAKIAIDIGVKRQKEFLDSLGLLTATPLEISEAAGGRPQLPPNWSELSAMTISYGHGIANSPVHLAAAYSSILNGGYKVEPTILKNPNPERGERVVSEQVSATMRDLLRQVVVRGTASFGEVAGYEVGGKTGTADKPNPQGGYYEDKVIATFASVFPASNPRYVLIVTLDEPSENSGAKPRRTAGWTAVPVAAEMIRRIAPLVGLRPVIEPGPGFGIVQAKGSSQ